MRRRTTIALLSLAAVVVGGGAVWYFLVRGDAPPPVSLEEAVGSLTSTTVTTTAGTDPTPTTTGPAGPTTTTADPGTALAGEWTIDTAASFAGYRVKEELASIGATEAVGRTSELTGGLTLTGEQISGVEVEVDMTTLRSDDSRRDGALRTRGLETDRFPTASFVLTEPIPLTSRLQPGDTIAATARGDLTLHGVTQPVEIPLEGQLVDAGTMVVVGSITVTITDYDIEPPTGFAVLSIDEVGTIELQLAFTRTAA